MAENDNKIDKAVERSANKIDQGIEEVLSSKYLRLLFKYVVSIIGGLVGGVSVFLVVVELSEYEETFRGYTFTKHDYVLSGFSGAIVGIIIFALIFKSIGKKKLK